MAARVYRLPHSDEPRQSRGLREVAVGAIPHHAILTVMKSTYTAIIERDGDTGLLVGYVPGFAGAHSQGATLDELHRNLREVIEMLVQDGEPVLAGEFIGTQLVTVE